MAILVLIDRDATNADPVKDARGCYKRGDIVDVGTYEFRLVCFPKTGAASDPATASAQILDQTAPVIATFTETV